MLDDDLAPLLEDYFKSGAAKEDMTMITVVRHHLHGRLEFRSGRYWDVYVEIESGADHEFLGTYSTLSQAEEAYYQWWEA